MINIYQPEQAKVISVKDESIDTKLLRLKFVDKNRQKDFRFVAGQFMQIGLPGWGECPISICSSSINADNFFELAIRDVGKLTHRLNQVKRGDLVEVRGPFGNGFDSDMFSGKPLILVGGGCGFVPLRPLIDDFVSGRLGSSFLQIFYGCLNEKTLLFRDEYSVWNRQAELNVILEEPSKKWGGAKGLVTDLFKDRKITADSVAVLVGPPVMYRFVIKELKKRKIKDENVLVSLEKRMHCGVGVCQHCAVGPYYVCQDGPVFRWSEIKDYYQV